jgi:hypothetical protein
MDRTSTLLRPAPAEPPAPLAPALPVGTVLAGRFTLQARTLELARRLLPEAWQRAPAIIPELLRVPYESSDTSAATP